MHHYGGMNPRRHNCDRELVLKRSNEREKLRDLRAKLILGDIRRLCEGHRRREKNK